LILLNCKTADQLKYVNVLSQVFADLFREMSDILSFIKSSNHSDLGAILQRIESYLVLDVICKKITQINSEIPVFTIHDCIITTVGNEGLVKEVIEQVLKDKIGAEPSVKFERWLVQDITQ